MGQNIVFWVIIIFSSLPILGMGVYAFVKKDPVHFYSGTTVKADEIVNVKKYNKANGIMWLSYGLGMLFFAYLVTILEEALGAVVFIGYIFIGLLLMVVAYKMIYRKYRKK